MRLKSQTWLLISVALFLAAAYFWHLGDREAARRAAATKTAPAASNTTSAVATPAPAAPAPIKAANTNAAAKARAYHLANTTQPLRQLERNDRAILLRNASIDTSLPLDLKIPDSLKREGEPGSYIVQARRALDPSFYALLRNAGAQFVSYIPNNAALVTASADAAAQLKGNSIIQSVSPYEPYYKLDSSLLPVAYGDKPMTNELFALGLFPNGREAALKELAKVGAEVLGEGPSPFGSEMIVRAKNPLVLAKIQTVMEIEPAVRPTMLNDLTRSYLGVAADSVIATNYLGLTGSNVLVAVNDSGVDAQHPDLVGRVFAVTNGPDWLLTDTNYDFGAGHGTHVAGIIAGDGTKSKSVTNASGSVLPAVDAEFRGKAPASKLFVQPVDLLSGPLISDAYLQEMASKSNAFICNNSWGYRGLSGYTMSSASYDAATRDAQPKVTGSQPLLFVFSAGNDGGGGDAGVDAMADTIVSPATAKNVLTVGALESPRNITNEVHYNGNSNGVAIWAIQTDTATQVAGYSSRGNVGIGLEGDYGRFKPDVVAPGTFVISTRATGWQDPVAQAYLEPFYFVKQTALSGTTNTVPVWVPDGGVLMRIQLYANAASPVPFPTNISVFSDQNEQPTTPRSGDFAVTPGQWYVGVYNPNDQPLTYDMGVFVLITNTVSDEFNVLSNLNTGLSQYYRYESGTSMAAPAVSGVLALMQEFLVERLKLKPSPALMKALLINGARPSFDVYDYQVNRLIPNDEGWGVVNLANSVPENLNTNTGPVQFFDQNPDTALSTGESCTHTIHLDTNAVNSPLRVTLVWTDPPGNPAAGIKLVNDLDLIVSNNVTGEIFLGNTFTHNKTYSETNADLSVNDVVNNVENVYLVPKDASLSSDYSIIVQAKRVNVNAVTAHTNGIVQDYALVVSSGATTIDNPFTIGTATMQTNKTAWVMTVTNGVPVLYQRVGANSPLLGGTTGSVEQWRFFVFKNEEKPTNTPYVALLTFMSPNLSSTPRNFDADIDLYVSTNPNLTNLDAAVIASADRSVKRGGTESILYTNSAPDTVYYIGVKAEDQKAAEFGFLAVASAEPFSQLDKDGNLVARAFSMPVAIPDGTPQSPSKVPVFAYSMDPNGANIRRVTLRERFNHPFVGDIFSQLSRGGGGKSVVVNNHSFTSGTNIARIYDDSGEVKNSLHTDGPGSLRDFVGEPVNGIWTFWMWDNAAAHDGSLEEFSLLIAPRPADPNDFYVTIEAGGWYFDYLDIPSDATNLNISVGFEEGNGPVDILLRKGDFPPPSDAQTNVIAPGGALNLSDTDLPVPLSGGRWFYGFHNTSDSSVTLHVIIRIDRSMTPNLVKTFVNTNGPSGLLDDALTNSSIFVPVAQPVLATQVGVRLDHSRASDLSLTLTSPQGTRVVLFEDRGGTNATELGFGTNANGYVYTVFTEDTNVYPQVIKFASPPYGSTVGVVTDSIVIFTNEFEGSNAWNFSVTNFPAVEAMPGIYTNGQTVEGWYVVSNLLSTTLVVTNGVTNVVPTNIMFTNMVAVVGQTNLAHWGTNYLVLGDGKLTRTISTVPGRPYRFTYTYRGPGIGDWWPGDDKANDLIGTNHGALFGTTFGRGKVNEAFTFWGTNKVDFGTNVGNFGTNDFTMDFWIKTTSTRNEAVIGKRFTCGYANMVSVTLNGGNGRGNLGVEVGQDIFGAHYANLASSVDVNDGVFHHVALVRQSTNLAFYIDGLPDAATITPGVASINNDSSFLLGDNPCVPGETSDFTGQLDEVDLFNRALTPVEIGAIYRAGANGKYSSVSPIPNATVIVDGISTNYILSNTNIWLTNTIGFFATDTQTTIELNGSPLGVLLDTIKLEELPSTNFDNYFLGEESLSAFKDENALGFWTLGIWDTRTGMALSNALLSWDLQITFSSTNVHMVTLTNGMPYTGTVTNEIRYFAIDVPKNANFATNVLISVTGDPLDLLFNQTGLPTGDLAGDVFLINNKVQDTNILNRGTVPFLVPGSRYFLGVRNQNAVSETFQLRVDFDVNTNAIVTPLTNGVALTNIVFTNSIQYYSFDVSPNATMATFEVLNPTNDVDLVVSRSLPLGPQNFEYISSNPGTNNELIIIRTNSAPVPLESGRWYLGVYGFSGVTAATYDVRATEMLANLIVLTNQHPFVATASSNTMWYFAVDVPLEADAVTNHLRSITGGSLELYFSQTDLPGTNDLRLLATTDGVAAITTNGIPPLLPGQRYFLWVRNPNPTPQQFSIDVAFDIPINPIELTNGVAFANTIGTNSAQYYWFNVDPNATRVQFDVLSPNGNVDMVVRHVRPYPDRLNYDYISAMPGTNDETIVISSNSLPVALTGGAWYVVVYNSDTVPVDYTIRAVEWVMTPDLIVLTNGIPVTINVPGGAIDYFAFDVPGEAVAVTNSLVSVTGDVLSLLYSEIGLPAGFLPGDVRLVDANPNGVFTLTPATTPAVQLGQRYYLGVRNQNAGAERFTIRVDTGLNIIPLTNAVPQTGHSTVPGVMDYYSFDVSATAQRVDFEVLNPDGDVDMVVRRGVVPTLQNYDYIASTAGSVNELITVLTNSTTPLAAGPWYIGIYKPSGASTVNYSVRASEWEIPSSTMVVLTNRVAYTNTVASNGTVYVAFDVPAGVSYTTNTLSSINPGDPLSLRFSPTGLPTGSLPGDVMLLDQIVSAQALASVTGPGAIFVPGQRYYLAIINSNNIDQQFVVEVDIAPPPVVTPLTNAVPYFATVETENPVQYYSFNVSSNATLVSFELRNANGYLGMAVSDGLAFLDFANSNPDEYLGQDGSGNQSVVVLPNSVPVGLTPGTWYVGIYNYEPAPVDYTVLVTELTTSGAGMQLLTLTNGVPFTNAVSGPGVSFDGASNFLYYQFTVTNDSPGVAFTLANASGAVDFIASLNTFPTPQTADAWSWGTGMNSKLLYFGTNAALPTVNGTWYLAVPNQAGYNVTYDLAATTLNTNLVQPALYNLNVLTNGVGFSWTTVPLLPYSVDLSTNLPDFLELTNYLSTSTNIDYIDATQLGTNVPRIYRVRETHAPDFNN